MNKLNCEVCGKTKVELPSNPRVTNYSYVCDDCEGVSGNRKNTYSLSIKRDEKSRFEFILEIKNENKKPTLVESISRYDNPYVFIIGEVTCTDLDVSAPLIFAPRKAKKKMQKVGVEEEADEYDLKILLQPKERIRFKHIWCFDEYYQGVNYKRGSKTYKRVIEEMDISNNIDSVRKETSELEIKLFNSSGKVYEKIKGVNSFSDKKVKDISKALTQDMF
jgi:hypothetical protein